MITTSKTTARTLYNEHKDNVRALEPSNITRTYNPMRKARALDWLSSK